MFRRLIRISHEWRVYPWSNRTKIWIFIRHKSKLNKTLFAGWWFCRSIPVDGIIFIIQIKLLSSEYLLGISEFLYSQWFTIKTAWWRVYILNKYYGNIFSLVIYFMRSSIPLIASGTILYLYLLQYSFTSSIKRRLFTEY
jgi:hypothetical protein